MAWRHKLLPSPRLAATGCQVAVAVVRRFPLCTVAPIQSHDRLYEYSVGADLDAVEARMQCLYTRNERWGSPLTYDAGIRHGRQRSGHMRTFPLPPRRHRTVVRWDDCDPRE